MNRNIDEYITIYGDLLEEINNPDTDYRLCALSVSFVSNFTFRELTDEVYECLLGDPQVARIQLAPAKEKVEFLMMQCSLLMDRYSDDPMFDILGFEKDIDLPRCELVYIVMDHLDRAKELFKDIKPIPDFKG